MSAPRKRRGDCTICDIDPEMNKLKERDDRFKEWELGLLATKMRCDSVRERLSEEQCAALYDWLFEENLTYAQAAERVRKEFGVETSVSGMGRMYRCLARTRQRIEVLDSQSYAELANGMPGTTREMRAATVKLLAASAVRRATEAPGQVEQLLPVAKVLLESEENEIRLRRMKLEEETFYYESAMARGGEMEKVRAHLEEIKNSRHLNAGEKQEQVKAAREFLFGPDEAPEGGGANNADEGGEVSGLSE